MKSHCSAPSNSLLTNIQVTKKAFIFDYKKHQAFIPTPKTAFSVPQTPSFRPEKTTLPIFHVIWLLLLCNWTNTIWPCWYNPNLFLCSPLGVQIQSPLAALQITRLCLTCWWRSLRDLRHAWPHRARQRHQSPDHALRPGRQGTGGQHWLGKHIPGRTWPEIEITHTYRQTLSVNHGLNGLGVTHSV